MAGGGAVPLPPPPNHIEERIVVSMKIYYDADADLGVLKGKKVAIIGFGSQGHAQALNLRDSGVDVLVSEMPGTPNYELAVKYKFKPVAAADAAKKAQVVQILTQDHVQAKLYENDLKQHMAGKTLLFSHGFNIHFGQIMPAPDVDVVMVAPKGPGHLVRSEYEKGAGVPSLVAIHQDASGRPWPPRWPTPRASAPRGPGCWRPPSWKRPKPTSSASSACSAGASPSWSRRASTPWWRRATPRRSPISSACMS
jgi:hypothetical protein